MSNFGTRDLKIACPSSLLRLRVMPRLLALSKRKYTPSCPGFSANARLPWSPPRGDSTLTTSAPNQASISVHDVPASNWVRSNTFTFTRALLIQFLLLFHDVLRPSSNTSLDY